MDFSLNVLAFDRHDPFVGLCDVGNELSRRFTLVSGTNDCELCTSETILYGCAPSRSLSLAGLIRWDLLLQNCFVWFDSANRKKMVTYDQWQNGMCKKKVWFLENEKDGTKLCTTHIHTYVFARNSIQADVAKFAHFLMGKIQSTVRYTPSRSKSILSSTLCISSIDTASIQQSSRSQYRLSGGQYKQSEWYLSIRVVLACLWQSQLKPTMRVYWFHPKSYLIQHGLTKNMFHTWGPTGDSPPDCGFQGCWYTWTLYKWTSVEIV